MSENWQDHDSPMFAGQKLVVVGGSSGMGRETAADVVAAGASAVIIGDDRAKVDDTVEALGKEGTAYGKAGGRGTSWLAGLTVCGRIRAAILVGNAVSSLGPGR